DARPLPPVRGATAHCCCRRGLVVTVGDFALSSGSVGNTAGPSQRVVRGVCRACLAHRYAATCCTDGPSRGACVRASPVYPVVALHPWRGGSGGRPGRVGQGL